MTWIKVGKGDLVARGDLKQFTLHEVEILVVNPDGELRCLDARCTHAGAPLAEGELRGSTLTCPWHGSQFDVTDGRVLRGPAQNPLRVYPTKTQDGFVFIEL